MKFLTALLLATSLATSLHAQTPSVADDADLRGTVGVCVRWDGPKHVADAVVVVSSGNPALDRAVPDTIRRMKWQRPDPPYHGEWVGIVMAVAGSAREMPLPSCAGLPLPDSAPGPAPKTPAQH